MADCTLALDASGVTAVLCMIDGGAILASTHIPQREQSRLLGKSMNMLRQEAKRTWADVSTLTYIAGPGSFTGLRIAAASLNGLNTKLKRPIMVYSSLAVAAMACGVKDPLWVLEDARANEVFVGCYQHGKPLQDDCCSSWPSVSGNPPAAYTASRAWDAQLAGIPFLPSIIPREEAIAQLLQYRKAKEMPYATPQYLQRSQAEKMQALHH
ncbi:MAG: tRNA (adenosine(37)-N6)-threonylcarbamoyltransferase complex dimerization subunit type 1 TsaB [Mariprofundaceae bacterium]|nr:tRNA (adenosine(37)-N6)-threonylcarbamoyltransferase complex dimerization subunit type 1 TsaB [Mariprofundaceae bacterium]